MKPWTIIATIAAALCVVSLAPAASASTPEQTPEPNPGLGLYGISGSLNLECSVPASAVKVKFRPVSAPGYFWNTVSASVTHGGLSYSISGLNRDLNYRVLPVLESVPEGCRFGHWSPLERQVGPPPAGSNVASGQNFIYEMPQGSTHIDGGDLVTAINFALIDAYVHLNNNGADDSYWRVVIGDSHPFSIPPKVHRICKGLGGRICYGSARFYVNDANSESVAATWSSGILLELSFESEGREIVGTGSNALVDSLVPDAELNDASLQVRLVLAANGQGGLTYRLVGTPSFSARLELVGGCSVLGVNVCPSIEDLNARLRSAVQTQLATLLQSPEAHAALDPALQELLDTYGVTNVDAVVTEGDGFLLLDF